MNNLGSNVNKRNAEYGVGAVGTAALILKGARSGKITIEEYSSIAHYVIRNADDYKLMKALTAIESDLIVKERSIDIEILLCDECPGEIRLDPYRGEYVCQKCGKIFTHLRTCSVIQITASDINRNLRRFGIKYKSTAVYSGSIFRRLDALSRMGYVKLQRRARGYSVELTEELRGFVRSAECIPEGTTVPKGTDISTGEQNSIGGNYSCSP